MKRYIALTIALFMAFVAGAQQVADLEKTILGVHRESGMQHGMLSVCVYNVSKSQEVYSYNSQMTMTPASVNKLFTTGVAFSRLGSDFRFTTQLGIRGEVDRDGVLHGNIYIIGGGDPMLGSYRYRQTTPDSLFEGWTRALKKKGIKRVDGRVCYNVNVFDEQPLHDSWSWGDVGNYYGAGVSGLNFHENMYFVYFNPGAKLGYPATSVRTTPKNINVLGICEVTTGPEGSGDNVTIYGSPMSNERLYRGTVPLGKKDFRVRGALPNPAKHCADLFASYLRTHGISISSNSMQVYSQPDSLRIVLDYYSSDYYTLAQYTNLTSNNIYAESIFKYLGYRKYGKGSFANGAKVYGRRQDCRRQWPVDAEQGDGRLCLPLPHGAKQRAILQRLPAFSAQSGRERTCQEPPYVAACRYGGAHQERHYGWRESLCRIYRCRQWRPAGFFHHQQWT